MIRLLPGSLKSKRLEDSLRGSHPSIYLIDFFFRFLKRLSKNSDAFRKRFIEHCICYMEATANEVTLRGEEGLTMSIEEYFPHRRNNGGIRACFDLIELSLGIELPAEVFEDPDFLRVHYAADDMICWSNV